MVSLRGILSVPRKIIGKTKLSSKEAAFRNQLIQAREPYFNFGRALATTPVKIGWALALLGPGTFPYEWLFGLGALTEGVGRIRPRTFRSIKEYEPDLLVDLVASSKEIDASFMARELAYRGGRKLTRKFLAELQEADGTKFNKVVEELQSRRLKALSLTKKIAIGLGHWLVFNTYLFLQQFIPPPLNILYGATIFYSLYRRGR